MNWQECAEAKIRQIERLRPLVGPPFEENPNTEAVIEAAIAKLEAAKEKKKPPC